MRRRFARRISSPNYLILILTAVLIIFGLLMLASASSNLGKEKFGDPYHYLKHQLIYGLGMGLIGFFAGYLIYYRIYEKIAVWLFFTTVILLILVFTPLGVTAQGATRWIDIGPIAFQPSEIAKIAFILYLASWLAHRTERQNSFLRGFLPLLLIIGLVAGLLLLEPATSTAFIFISASLVMYFASGAKFSHIIQVAFLGTLLIVGAIYFSDYKYKLNRLVNFIRPEANLETTGYHLKQSQIAIGSGGLFGAGYGASTTKLRYLPEPVGDSIFAVIAEEFGFVGSAVLIGTFGVLVIFIFLLARRHRDKFAALALFGFGALIAIQSFIHIGAISGLIPLTGMPLPFISYGGTSLIAYLTIIGIIGNMSKYA